MSLRSPSTHPASSLHRSRAEIVVGDLLAYSPVIDRALLEEFWHGDPHAIRYSRDALNLFTQLGQLQHVRRELWVERPLPGDPRAPLLRLAAAARCIGDWPVVAGTWALRLHGLELRHVDPASTVDFVLTTRRARPATYADRYGDRTEPSLPRGANELRHVTTVLDRPVAAVTRPAHRIGDVQWMGTDSIGGHVLALPAAFVSLLEHPRLSGGSAVAATAALPVMARTGLDALLDVGSRHPVLAVRRRMAFVLFHAVARTDGCIRWFGSDGARDGGKAASHWRILSALDISRQRAEPTLLDPHRARVGRLDRRFAVVDNRRAPLLPRAGVLRRG